MRTSDEIVERLNVISPTDYLGFRWEVLASRLPYDRAVPFLKADTPETRAEWAMGPTDDAGVLEEARSYAEFGWGKIEGHRGISAGRTIDKMTEYAWLLGRDDVVAGLERIDYPQYGAPMLAYICRALGFSIPAGVETQRMIRGEPCRDDCEEGCGL